MSIALAGVLTGAVIVIIATVTTLVWVTISDRAEDRRYRFRRTLRLARAARRRGQMIERARLQRRARTVDAVLRTAIASAN